MHAHETMLSGMKVPLKMKDGVFERSVGMLLQMIMVVLLLLQLIADGARVAAGEVVHMLRMLNKTTAASMKKAGIHGTSDHNNSYDADNGDA